MSTMQKGDSIFSSEEQAGRPTSVHVAHGLWVKLYMDLSSIGPCSKPSTRHIFMDLLTLAEAHPRRRYLNGVPVNLTTGQVHTTLSQLSEHTGYTFAVLRTALRQLEEFNMINIRTTNRHTIISICDWDTYQDLGGYENNRSTKPHIHNSRSKSHSRSDKELTDNQLRISESQDLKLLRNNRGISSTPAPVSDSTTVRSSLKVDFCESSLSEWFDCALQVGTEFDQPVKSTVWQNSWMSELPEIREDILLQSSDSRHSALFIFEHLLRNFYADRDRSQRKALLPSYFKSDWPCYWSITCEKLNREKETRFYEAVEEVQRDLKRQRSEYSPDGFRDEAIRLVISRNRSESTGGTEEATA